jgi:hypothetical protein
MFERRFVDSNHLLDRLDQLDRLDIVVREQAGDRIADHHRLYQLTYR